MGDGVLVRPFRAFIPPQSDVGSMICPTYDAVSHAQIRTLADASPHNLIHVCHPEIDAPGRSSNDPYVLHKGLENLQNIIKDGHLQQVQAPAFYPYRQRTGNRTQCGIFALVSCEQYRENVIRKHEQTREDVERAGTNTIRALRANVSAVFLSFKASDSPDLTNLVHDLMQTPSDRSVRLEHDGTDNDLWVVTDPSIVAQITQLFSTLPALYIADGHHRAASAFNLWEEKLLNSPNGHLSKDDPYAYFMAGIYADTELEVMDYNRIITGISSTYDEIIESIKMQGFEISELVADDSGGFEHFARPVQKWSLSMCMDGQWYKLQFVGSPKTPDAVNSIESQILTDFILEPVFRIRDIRSDPNIQFLGGHYGMERLEDAATREATVAFAVPSVRMPELFEVADAGHVMPPRSTWFLPKIATGLVVRVIEDD
jgi:uncharacterized protein (DUF1015 family)